MGWRQHFWDVDSTGGGAGGFVAAPTAADALTFCAGSDATAATAVTVSGVQNAGSLAFTSGSVTLSGGTVTLGGAGGSVTVAAGQSATVNSVIAGSVGLTNSGAGTLTLAAANTYSGVTTWAAGQLNINDPGTFGTSALANTGNTTIDNTSGHAVVVSGSHNFTGTLGKTVTFIGSNDLDLGAGTWNTAALTSTTWNVLAGNLTLSANVTAGKFTRQAPVR